ncbi:MAG TPA: tetratricopeptide repeat protein [Bryobacteraceae bacterium]|nr:tetratricopeptide repeat protein [Bryobacteraceae bacterium]
MQRRARLSATDSVVRVLLFGWVALANLPVSAQPGNSYFESRVCSSCHPSQWETYRRTGMGRSFYRPEPDNVVEDYKTANDFYHPASDTHFTMLERDGRYYQRQYQIGFDGNQTNIREEQIDFIIGSGNHSRTYLHRTSRNTLIELPLAWYSEKGGYWAMNPGYDRPDHQGFRRLIGYECMFCHNAYPEIPTGSGADPVYSRVPEGIDCQRCHGPGAEHVRLARAGASSEQVRRNIANPARLPAERRMDVCLQCHLETTSFPLPNSIVRYERAPFSYRPGEPLGDFMLHFDHAPGTGYDDKFEIAGGAYRLMQSACFQKSNGALGCTTCHNPHDAPRGEQAARHYTAVCRQCHAAALDRLVASERHPRSSDCTGCHMPKRRTDDVVHVVMTDHLIQRRKPARDLLAEIPERHVTDDTAYRGEVVLYHPRTLSKPEDELYLAVAQLIQNSNLHAGIPRLSAAIEKYRPERPEYYGQLGDALRASGKCEQAVPLYEQALQKNPGSLGTMQKLALCLLDRQQRTRAAEVLRRALQATPDDASTWHMLATTYLQQGQTADAVAALQKALELDPEMPESYNSLGGIWQVSAQAERAEPMLRTAIRLQPNYPEAHHNLAILLSAAGRFDEARYHFEAALRLKANYTSARCDYAVALARVGRLEEAQSQIETGLRLDPNSAAAHELFGTLLAERGQPQRALEQYREALRIRPDLGQALLHIGETLLDSGDAAAAQPYLQKAAQSPERAVREEAAKVLERIRKSH